METSAARLCTLRGLNNPSITSKSCRPNMRASILLNKWAVSAVFSSGHVRALSEEDVEGGVYHQIEQTATETIYLGQPKPLLF